MRAFRTDMRGGRLAIIVMAAVSFLAGYKSYGVASPAEARQADSRSNLGNFERKAEAGHASRVIDDYASILAIAGEKKVAAAVAKPDSADVVRLVGIVEKDGLRQAVFLVEVGGASKLVVVKPGQKVLAEWALDRIDLASVTISKSGQQKKFSLFE